MENTAETLPNEAILQTKRGFGRWCATSLRWLTIGLLAIALGQFLYLVFALNLSFD